MGENLADLGGLSLAVQGMLKRLHGAGDTDAALRKEHLVRPML